MDEIDKISKDVLNNILYLKNKKGITDAKFCSEFGVNPKTFDNWKRGRSKAYMKILEVLACYFDVTTEYLLYGESAISNLKKEKSIKIPVLGYVRAGIPVEAVEDILDYEEIPQEWAKQGDYFALRVKGNSMEPRICEGDVVIVNRMSDIESGDLAIVLINGEDATVKKVVKNSHGITLVPFNPAYQPMMFSNKEILQLPVTIIGKVVELRAKF